MLSQSQIHDFDEHGYIVVPEVIPAHLVASINRKFDEIVVQLCADAVNAGLAPDDLLALPPQQALIELTRTTGRNYNQHFDISLPNAGDITTETPINVGPEIFALLVYEPLLDLVESIVGPEIWSNPTQHVRIKLPGGLGGTDKGFLAGTVPWHQDNGVLLEEADASHILTVWTPLSEATRENGCLEVVPGSHRNPVLQHCFKSGQLAIPDGLVEACGSNVALEMTPGSILLMHQRTIHRSRENSTRDQVRVSLDLRYQPAGEPSGRPLFPGFLARSRNEAEEVRDPRKWADLWIETRERLSDGGAVAAGAFSRWTAGGQLCA